VIVNISFSGAATSSEQQVFVKHGGNLLPLSNRTSEEFMAPAHNLWVKLGKIVAAEVVCVRLG